MRLEVEPVSRRLSKNRESVVVKYLAAALLVFGLLGLTSLIYLIDQSVGIVAHTGTLLTLSAVVGLGFGAVWRLSQIKHAVIAGGVAFLTLAIHIVLPAPAERLLQLAMFEVPIGAKADAIQEAVHRSYAGSPYGVPEIQHDVTHDGECIYVSLFSLEPGNCTTLTFLVKEGRVVHRSFSAD